MMTATYSPEDNKLRLYSSTRLDSELYQRVRNAGFIWAPKQELFVAPMWTPDREDLLIELAGDIGDEDTSLVDRAEDRAGRFEDYSDKRAADGDAAHKTVDYIAQRFEGGQPILVGHHSEKSARKDAERIENGMRKALKMWETSKYWTRRAEGALHHAKYKQSPEVRARRIKTIEAEVRSYRARYTPSSKQVLMQQEWKAGNVPAADAPKVPHIWCAPRGGRGGSWVPLHKLPALEAYYSRWIRHAELRLEYERAMLNEQGAADLLKPKPRSTKATLPLCNYRAPEGLDIENIYRRAEMIHYPQIEMTQAQYSDISNDYKATRVVSNSHRVRTAMRSGSLYCVFITDSKTHVPPGASAPEPVTEPRCWPAMQPTPEPSETEKKIASIRAAVNAGVKVVTAPQLFPTPASLAERMVEIADIQPGQDVLEPSAGTGAIVDAIRRTVSGSVITAVEVNHDLARHLAEVACLGHDRVHCKDFLECNGDLGKFERVLMNPPFSDGQDIAHIRHAMNMLKPGGRLVAICAGGPRQQEKLKPLAATWEPLPAGTFRESGTGVNTVLMTYDAPEAEQQPAAQTLTGETISLFPMGSQ